MREYLSDKDYPREYIMEDLLNHFQKPKPDTKRYDIIDKYVKSMKLPSVSGYKINEYIPDVESLLKKAEQIDALREFESKPNNREFGGAKAKKKSSKKPPAAKKKPPAAATGKVHTGPRGGKYVIRNGHKVYL